MGRCSFIGKDLLPKGLPHLVSEPKRGRPTPEFSMFVRTFFYFFFIFLTDSEPPIKLLIGVLIIGDRDPPNHPYGGPKNFFGGYD